MSDEERQKFNDAWEELKQSLIELLKIEEIIGWLSKKLDKTRRSK